MPDSRGDLLAKGAFMASLLVVAFLYGFAAHGFGLFPNDLLEAGWRQFRQVKQAVWDEGHPATEPRVYDRQGARIVDSTAVQPGLTLVPSVWEDFDWKPGLKLIDVNGRIVHEWEVDPARLFPSEFSGPLTRLSEFNQPHGSYLFPDGDVLVVLSGLGTARLDACSRVQWRVRADHHHSVARAADGTFWVSGREQERAEDPITGLDSVRHDQLVHLSADGEILDEIAVFDIIRENDEILRQHLRIQPDDTHLNDVEPLPPAMAEEYSTFEGGDLLVSLKHLNAILVVNPESLEVRWWTGKPFIQQHDPDFVGNGWIGVFDNREDGTERGTRLGGSRIVAFERATDSTDVWMDSSEADALYTHNRGNWQRLEGGNSLVTESNAGRIAEFGPEGELVWEWVQPPYDEARVPRVYWAERYDMNRQDAVAWPCSPAAKGEEPLSEVSAWLWSYRGIEHRLSDDVFDPVATRSGAPMRPSETMGRP